MYPLETLQHQRFYNRAAKPMNTFLLPWMKPQNGLATAKRVILEPALIDGEVNGGMWKGQCMGMCVQRVQKMVPLSGMLISSWIVANQEFRWGAAKLKV